MKVTLKKPHRHADQPYDVGDKIEVDRTDAEWLQARGVIDEPALRAAVKTDAPSTPPAI